MADDDRPDDEIPWYAPGHHCVGIPRQRQPARKSGGCAVPSREAPLVSSAPRSSHGQPPNDTTRVQAGGGGGGEEQAGGGPVTNLMAARNFSAIAEI